MYIIFIFIVNYPFAESTIWEYSTEYEEGWNTFNFSSTWNKGNISSIPITEEDITLYLRAESSFSEVSYTSFYIRLSHISGVVAYLNGVEYYRKFITGNPPSPTDYANGKFEDITDIKFVLPGTRLDSKTTTIAIELHRSRSEGNFPGFRYFLIPFAGDSDSGCATLNNYIKSPITEYSTELQKTDSNPVSYGFDNLYDTYWSQDWSLSANPTTWAKIQIEDNTFIQINYFTIIAESNDKSTQAKKIRLLGYISDEEEEIAVYENITYGSVLGKYKTSNQLYNEVKLRNGFKIEVSEKYSGDTLNIRDFLFYSCPIRYCDESPEIGLPRNISGTVIELPCKTGSGSRTFECQISSNTIWVQKENSCEDDEPQIIFSQEMYYFTQGERVKDATFVSFSGVNLQYTLSPSFNNLTINPDTGAINGIVVTNASSTTLTISVVTGKSKSKSVKIPVYVEIPTSPILIEGGEDILATVGVKYTNKEIFTVLASTKITAMDLPNSLTFKSTNGVGIINGMIEDEGKYTVTFTAINDKGKSLIFSIKFIAIQPEKPSVIKKTNQNLYYAETYQDLYPLKCAGKDLVYSTGSTLPQSLTYSEKGELYGTITSSPETRTYRFTCTSNNVSVSDTTSISITYSSYPIIIDYKEYVELIAGDEYEGLQFCNVTGSKVVYSLTPQLPKKLSFNTSTAEISGYYTKGFSNTTYTLIATASSKIAYFQFTMASIVEQIPTYIKSTVIDKYKFIIGKETESIELFEPVGDNLYITIKPDLPKGLFVNSKTGAIYGVTNEEADRDFTFIISNSYGSSELKIHLTFSGIFCPADSGFPETLAVKDEYVEVKIGCGGIQSGKKTRKCYINNKDEGVWTVIIDECEISTVFIVAMGIVAVALLVIIFYLIICLILRCGGFKKRVTADTRKTKRPKITEQGLRM